MQLYFIFIYFSFQKPVCRKAVFISIYYHISLDVGTVNKSQKSHLGKFDKKRAFWCLKEQNDNFHSKKYSNWDYGCVRTETIFGYHRALYFR